VLLADRQAQLTPARLVGPRWLVIEVVSSTSKRDDMVNLFSEAEPYARTGLRELNDLTLSRLEARLEQRVTQRETRLEGRLAARQFEPGGVFSPWWTPVGRGIELVLGEGQR